MKHNPEIAKRITELDCEFRFVQVAETYTSHESGGEIVVDSGPKHKKPGTYCHLLDKPTGEYYVEGYASGFDETGALEDALAKAVTAPKPLTPAQKLHRQHVDNVVSEKDAKIADLERQLLEFKSSEVLKPKK
jgi:hypothetical protein